MSKSPEFQFVWPKEGKKGKNCRSFFGGFKDIVTGKGPDMFIQKAGSKSPIKPQHWGNWDSYHSRDHHSLEERDGQKDLLWNQSRHRKRYDPHSRKYVEWAHHDDFDSRGVDGRGMRRNGDGYPHFTGNEWICLVKMVDFEGGVGPVRLGKDWDCLGPKRINPTHDDFWQDVHEIGADRANGSWSVPTSFFQTSNCYGLNGRVNQEVGYRPNIRR